MNLRLGMDAWVKGLYYLQTWNKNDTKWDWDHSLNHGINKFFQRQHWVQPHFLRVERDVTTFNTVPWMILCNHLPSSGSTEGNLPNGTQKKPTKPQIPAIPTATFAFFKGPPCFFKNMSCRLSKTIPGNNAMTVSKFKAKVSNYSVGGEEHNLTHQTVLCWMLANWPKALPYL